MTLNILKEQVLLSKYTTLRTGGIAKYFLVVENEGDLEEVGRFAKQTALPLLFVGGGSNLLISDTMYEGVVILNRLKGREYIENADGTMTLICKAGEALDEVIDETVQKGLWGLENLSAIPGTVGATPVQNVGAYGVEVSDTISSVETYHMATNTRRVFQKAECNFGYRDSFFKTEEGKEYLITAVHFKLSKTPNPIINYSDLKKRFTEVVPTQKEIRDEIIEIRSKKFPDWHKIGTAGSFFKNPFVSKKEAEDLLVQYPELPVYFIDDQRAKISLGYVLDKICHLKGYREGNIELYSEQALVLVNYGMSNADEIKKFSKKIIDEVYSKTKIIITPEVCFI